MTPVCLDPSVLLAVGTAPSCVLTLLGECEAASVLRCSSVASLPCLSKATPLLCGTGVPKAAKTKWLLMSSNLNTSVQQ